MSGCIASFDVLTEHQQDADALAETISAGLTDEGATGVFVASHPAQANEERHIALSISAHGVDTPSRWWDVLSRAVRTTAADGVGLAVDDRYIGTPRLREPVAAAARAHATRTSGRVIVFPGVSTLKGTMTVEQLIAASAIDRVRVLAGGVADDDTPVRTRDFIRPRWTGGELVLDTQPSVGGTLVPFETPFPTPCCGEHA